MHLLEGRPFPVKLALPLRGDRVLGIDIAGTVHSVGESVTAWAPGDAVFGAAQGLSGHGGLAEFARARSEHLLAQPSTLDQEEAAVVPVSATAALHAVRDAAHVAAGHRVLVLGAGGGVGHFAVQIAKALGAHVTGACSPGKAAMVESLGADVVIDYTTQDPLEAGPYDAIIDTGGHRPLRHMRRALTRTGAVVLVGSEPEGAPLGGLSRSLWAALVNPFTRHRLVMLNSSIGSQALQDLAELIEAGMLRPVIHARYPLEHVSTAVQQLGRGRGTGKTVITVAQPAEEAAWARFQRR
ncbi:NAD(P)-dependent alcohol dehydrogenase [Nesterenkonia flava]